MRALSVVVARHAGAVGYVTVDDADVEAEVPSDAEDGDPGTPVTTGVATGRERPTAGPGAVPAVPTVQPGDCSERRGVSSRHRSRARRLGTESRAVADSSHATLTHVHSYATLTRALSRCRPAVLRHETFTRPLRIPGSNE
jgi:hypothetical protein